MVADFEVTLDTGGTVDTPALFTNTSLVLNVKILPYG